jgi:hypothetical protein
MKAFPFNVPRTFRRPYQVGECRRGDANSGEPPCPCAASRFDSASVGVRSVRSHWLHSLSGGTSNE